MTKFELATHIAAQALLSNAGVDTADRDAFSAIAACNAPSFKGGETLPDMPSTIGYQRRVSP